MAKKSPPLDPVVVDVDGTPEMMDGRELSAPLYEFYADVPTTRGVVLARKFMERFSDKILTASETNANSFALTAAEFDSWLVEIDEVPESLEAEPEDVVGARGRSQIRNETRRLINRAAALGKSFWPPFSIEPSSKGATYEVRLREYYAASLTGNFGNMLKGYIVNKNKHWAHISKFMHSDRVAAEAPEAAMAFYGIEQRIEVTMAMLETGLKDIDKAIMAAHQKARTLLAAAASKSEPQA